MARGSTALGSGSELGLELGLDAVVQGNTMVEWHHRVRLGSELGLGLGLGLMIGSGVAIGLGRGLARIRIRDMIRVRAS